MARVIVIGAGLSGLSAARRLLAEGINVLVLEARDQIGGRMRLARVPAPGRNVSAIVDLGGQWVGPYQEAILDLASELGITWFDQYTEGFVMVNYNDTVYQTDNDPPAPTADDQAAAAALDNALGEAAKDIDQLQPWKSPNAATLDRRTLGQWIEASGELNVYARFYVGLDATFNQSGGSPHEVSLLNSLFERKANPPKEEPDKFLLNGGAGQIPAAMVDKYKIPVRTGARVTAISQGGGKVNVTVAGSAAAEQGDAAIVAMPPSLTAAIHYDPAPSARRIQLASRMAMGTIAKVALVYDAPWWRDKGISGTAISSSLTVRATADSGLRDDGAPGILTSFIQGDQLIGWSGLSPGDRVTAVKNDLSVYFGDDVVKQPSTYSEMIWPREQFTGGAYNGYLPPGGWTSYGQAIRERHDRIFWAGTETATRWFGYFDGAVTAGYRAAEEALVFIQQ